MIKKILIAEDEKVMRYMLSDFLQNFNFEIIQAENGEIAWKLWNEIQCDLIITDINMPHMNGIELLKNIKKKQQDFPVIVITGVSVESAQANAIENGADAFLTKPFKMKTLVEIINSIFQKK